MPKYKVKQVSRKIIEYHRVVVINAANEGLALAHRDINKMCETWTVDQITRWEHLQPIIEEI